MALKVKLCQPCFQNKNRENQKSTHISKSSEPEYPGAKLETFASVIKEVSKEKKVNRIGVVGSRRMLDHACDL